MFRTLTRIASVFVYLALALPTPVILHAFDHAIDHLSHGHDHHTPADDAHHDAEHDHNHIFAFRQTPETAPRTMLNTAALRPTPDTMVAAVPASDTQKTILHRTVKASGPPLRGQGRFAAPLANKAPPA